MAVSIGDENATLVSTENYTIVPANTMQPYIVHQHSALGALHAASLDGDPNYTVTNVMPAEMGYLLVTSVAGIENRMENDTPVSWTYWLNGDEMQAGPAQKRVNSGDTVTYSYGPANHTLAEAAYTLNISVTVVDESNETAAAMTVADVLGQQENLTTLAAAVNATGLTEPLSQDGPYTVFAPTDAAFEALGNETVDQLMNETDRLTAVLQYHVVEGNYTSQQLMEMTQNQTMNQTANMTQEQNVTTGNQTTNQTANMTQNQTANMTMENVTGTQTMENVTAQQQAAVMLQTLLGQNLTVSQNQSTGDLMAGNATIVMADINASNGVVHVIDAVLMPPENVTAAVLTEPGATPADQSSAIISEDSGDLTIINRTG
ncbi:fasciclin domain-containing protein [Methanoculleus frigidifontis]|nr:fasciclin domain-containing protein [Methanoculleus sp. FWC-SCC1]